MEQILIVIIVGASLLFFIRHITSFFKAKNPCDNREPDCGCGGCEKKEKNGESASML